MEGQQSSQYKNTYEHPMFLNDTGSKDGDIVGPTSF